MKICGMTDIGSVRKENQDTFAICDMQEPAYAIAVVCDGMGGANGGQTASRLAVDTYLESIQRELQPSLSPQQLLQISDHAVAQANAAVHQKSLEVYSLQGMGTTLISAVSYADGVVISNVGDSRAYLLTAEKLVQISRDHSVVEKLVEMGDITHEEARHHPNRNLITRALGPDELLQCDGFIQPLQAGERVLLCTDGLVDVLTDEEIFQLACLEPQPEQLPQRLIEQVKEKGASDNVTVVLLWNE